MAAHESVQEAWDLFKDKPEALNDWESNFLTDNFQRFEQYGAKTRFSDKQENQIEKILEKLRKAS